MNAKDLSVLVATIFVSACAAPPPALSGTSPMDQMEFDSLVYAEQRAAELRKHLDSGVTEKDAIEQAKAAITRELKDPESARFRDITVRNFQGGKVICGEMNAKNSYGGYVGFKRFMASHRKSVIEEIDQRHPDVAVAANAGIDAACAPPVPKELATRKCPPDVLARLAQSGLRDAEIAKVCGRPPE